MWNVVKARANYGYEFLIKMTFIWEPDEDKRAICGIQFLGGNFAGPLQPINDERF